LDEYGGMVRIVTLNDLIEQATGVVIGDTECDTFTGLVFNMLGQVPNDEPQKIELEISRMKICVSKVEEHQIS